MKMYEILQADVQIGKFPHPGVTTRIS